MVWTVVDVKVCAFCLLLVTTCVEQRQYPQPPWYEKIVLDTKKIFSHLVFPGRLKHIARPG